MATHYIDTITGSDNNTGQSEVSAWRTISKINSQPFYPGDSILFKRGGVWGETLAVPSAGGVENPITFAAYGTGPVPIIDGDNVRARTILIEAKANVSVKDIDCRNSAISAQSSVYVNNSAGIILDGLVVNHNQGFAGIYVKGTGDGNVVKNCAVSYTAHATADRGDGIIIDGPGRNHSIIDCVSHHNHASGIKEKLGSLSEALAIRGCTTYQNGAAGISINGDGAGPSDCIIEHNHVYEFGLTEADYWGIDLFKCGNDNIVRYNLIHDDHYIAVCSGGIRLDAQPGDAFGDRTQIYYNIIYNVRDGFTAMTSFASFHNNVIYNIEETAIFINDDFVTSGEIKNNITHTVKGKHVRYNYATNVVFDHNCYYGGAGNWYGGGATRATFALWKAAISGDANSANADPKFVDPVGHDFRLQPDSPCIGAGANVGLTEDIEGNVIEGNPDIGAYEHVEQSMSIKKSVPLTLVVTAAPDFFPAVVPTSVSVAKGVVAIYNVTFTAAGGFTGPMTLAALNLPAGAVATFDKPSINIGETAVLSITTTGVALGTFAFSVEGMANL